MSGENSYDCAYTIPYRAVWKLGLTAFAEVSEALSSVCCGVEGGKEKAMGCGLKWFLSISTSMIMPL